MPPRPPEHRETVNEEDGRTLADFDDVESGTVRGDLAMCPGSRGLDDPIRIDQGHRLPTRLIARGEGIPGLGQLDQCDLGRLDLLGLISGDETAHDSGNEKDEADNAESSPGGKAEGDKDVGNRHENEDPEEGHAPEREHREDAGSSNRLARRRELGLGEGNLRPHEFLGIGDCLADEVRDAGFTYGSHAQRLASSQPQGDHGSLR